MNTIHRREFLRRALAVGAAGGMASLPAWKAFAQEAAGRKWNVLFIMSDQHNARALSCYGNTEMQTPNMDRLAREGVRFDRAFCQTGQCCPSRYTIWTGRYAHSHGCWRNGDVEPLEEVTVGEVFSQAGYATATIGKHHMVHDPKEHGFACVVDVPEYQAFVEKEGGGNMTTRGDWLKKDVTGLGRVGASALDNDHSETGFFAAETIRFLDENKDKPFCVWSSFYGPHTPITPSRPWADQYKPEGLTLPPSLRAKNKNMPNAALHKQEAMKDVSDETHRRILAYYYGYVSQIDFNIGRILDELDHLGLADHTVVVYTADHGEMMGEHGFWTKTIANYDSTIRVPMIIRVPGRFPAGKAVEELVGSIDLMPTLCDLAGLPIPSKVQGSSLVLLVEGKATKWRDVIFSEIGVPDGSPAGYSVMARTAEAKYVATTSAGKETGEFFNLKKDPWEMNNEIDNPAYAPVIADLKARMDEWNKTTDRAPIPPRTEKTTGKGGRRAQGEDE